MIGALVLAAGLSRRMGAFKPLLDLCGVPALARAVRSVRGFAGETLVVTGHRHGELSPLIAAEGAVELYNPAYPEGMFTSVRAGIGYFAARGAEGVLLLPGDCPAVPKEAVKELLVNAGDGFAVPGYGGRRGHPMWIPARLFAPILEHDGRNGLKPVLERFGRQVLDMPFIGTVLDMDEPEDHAALEALLSLPSLRALGAGRRFLLLRHGATELHSGKIVMGRYDARLSAVGREQAEAAAEALAGMDLRCARIYSSPLSRARDSAEILRRRLGLETELMDGLQELSLGAWDGLLIDEVRRRWPEGYEKRGRELMAYRFDAGCESFYDLQQRAGDCLRAILTADASPDILLVSHAGVLKCLYGLLMGESIDWAFPRFRPEKGELTVLRL